MVRPFIDRPASVSLPRLVARVTGERALEFLHAVTSQDVAALKPGAGALAAYLDEKGHVLAELRVLVAPEGDVFLDADEPSREGLERMARIAPLSGVEVSLESWTRTVVRGAGAAEALARFAPLPSENDAVTRSEGALIVRDTWRLDGFDVLSPEALDVGVQRATEPEWEAARIAAGRPAFGIDITTDSLINETPLADRAVSFSKGCYPGQESVARVRNLGRARWMMVTLRSPETIEVGSIDDGGRISSAARTADGFVAIATVRVGVDRVSVAGADLEVVPID